MTTPIAGSRFCGLCAEWVLREEMQEETKRQMGDLERTVHDLQATARMREEYIAKLEGELDRARLAIAMAPGFAKGKARRAGVA